MYACPVAFNDFDSIPRLLFLRSFGAWRDVKFPSFSGLFIAANSFSHWPAPISSTTKWASSEKDLMSFQGLPSKSTKVSFGWGLYSDNTGAPLVSEVSRTTQCCPGGADSKLAELIGAGVVARVGAVMCGLSTNTPAVTLGSQLWLISAWLLGTAALVVSITLRCILPADDLILRRDVAAEISVTKPWEDLFGGGGTGLPCGLTSIGNSLSADWRNSKAQPRGK
jgi:hypothetical protein